MSGSRAAQVAGGLLVVLSLAAVGTHLAGEQTEVIVLRRLRAEPRAELVRNGAARTVVARPQKGVEARAAIDRAFREKYGVVDWWYGVLLRRDAIPVRLEPAPARVGSARTR